MNFDNDDLSASIPESIRMKHFGRKQSLEPNSDVPDRFATPEFSRPQVIKRVPSQLWSRQQRLIRIDHNLVGARRRRDSESRFVAIGEHSAQEYPLPSHPHSV
jgi:hypothetical protein